MIKLNAKDTEIKSFLGFSIPTWINAAIGFLAIPIVTRLFEPEVLGKFNVFNTYGILIVSIVLMGLNQGLMRFYHEPPGRNSTNGLYKLILMLIFFATFVTTTLIFVFGNNLSTAIIGVYDLYTLVCLSLFVMASAYLTIKNSLFRMQNSILAFGILSIILNLASKVTYAGAVLSENKFQAAITLLTGTYLLVAILYFINDFITFRNQKIFISRFEIIPLLKYSLPLLPVLFIVQINTALPKLFISSYLNYAQVGIFSAGVSIVGLISIIQSGINAYWAPFVFKNYDTNPNYLKNGHSIISFVMILFGLIIVLLQDLIYVIIGPAYRESQQFFVLLLIAPIFYTISETTGVGINISKKTYFNIAVYFFVLVITIILSVLLIPSIGLHGAAIAVAGGGITMLIGKTFIGEIFYNVISNPVKSFLGPSLFVITIIANTIFFNEILIRSFLTVSMTILFCLIYNSELLIIFNTLLKKLKKESKGD